MKKFQTRQQGFTLIELIVVIVILGIMSAVAVPQFVNLQSDARASVMAGVEGSVRSAATLVYSKSLINGSESGTSTVSVNGTSVATENGYPTTASIGLVVDLTGTNGDVTEAAGTFTYTGQAGCTVVYADSLGAGQAPVVTNNADASSC